MTAGALRTRIESGFGYWFAVAGSNRVRWAGDGGPYRVTAYRCPSCEVVELTATERPQVSGCLSLVLLLAGLVIGVAQSATYLALLLVGMVGGVRAAEQPPVRTDRNGDPLPEGAVARLGTLRFRHGGAIHALAFTPDGKTIASGGEGDAICLWDTATGKLRRRISVSGWVSYGLTFSPDGKLLAAADEHGEVVTVLDAASGKPVYRPEADEADASGKVDLSGSPGGIAFTPDGKTVAWCTGEAICLLDVTRGKVSRALTVERMERFVTLAPDGKTLFAASREARLIGFDPTNGKRLRSFDPHHERIHTAAVSSDGKTLAAACEDGSVWLTDLATGKHRLAFKVAAGVDFVAFAPDGKHALASGHHHTSLWDLDAARMIRRFPVRSDPVALSPDGKLVAAGGEGGTVRLWRAATGEDACPPEGHSDPVRSVTFLPDGKTLVSGGAEVLLSWDVATGTVRRRFQGPTQEITSVACSPDGTRLATGHRQAPPRLWDAKSGEKVRELGPEDSDAILSFSADGTRLATAGVDRRFQVWDVAGGRLQRSLLDLRNPKAFRRFSLLSPDGRFIASGGRGLTTGLHALDGWKLQRWYGEESATAAAFSPDGKLLAAGSREVVCWEVDSGRELFRLERYRGDVDCLAFSPDGRLLAAASDTVVRVCEVATGRERRRFDAMPDRVCWVAPSPDNRTFATAGPSGVILLWDVLGTGPASAANETDRDSWERLAIPDAGPAHGVIRRMVAEPGRSLPFLRERLRPITADPKRIGRLIADLDGDEFETRERAGRELASLQEAAAPALREAVKSSSAEVRRRATALLEALDDTVLSGERLRMIRVVEVLERIGSAESRRLLDELARGGAELRLTREAKAAAQRLTQRR